MVIQTGGAICLGQPALLAACDFGGGEKNEKL